MAQHTVAPVDFGEHKLSAGAAPAWSPPNDASPPYDAKGQPDSSEYPVPSAPDPNDLPPNYYDISIVPDNAVLHYNEVTPYTEPSAAVVERKKDGVMSFDPLIDRNPDQLWLYFMTYLNEKPSLVMNIHGYHVERYIDYEQYRDANGNFQTRAVHRTRNVTDFNFGVDASNYVSQQWWRVAVIPSKQTQKTGEMITLRDALEQYTRSEKNIKQIICQKQLVGWNFHELRDKITSLIYSTGYRSHISVSFSVENNRIAARASSNMSRFSNSTVVRVLCVISCMFLIFGPIYLCLRAAGSTKDQIVADYSMGAPVDAFLYQNSRMIANAAIARSRERYMAYPA